MVGCRLKTHVGGAARLQLDPLVWRVVAPLPLRGLGLLGTVARRVRLRRRACPPSQPLPVGRSDGEGGAGGERPGRQASGRRAARERHVVSPTKTSALAAELSTHESYLPFRYCTSGPSCCCTWSVDDVQVEGRPSVAVPRPQSRRGVLAAPLPVLHLGRGRRTRAGTPRTRRGIGRSRPRARGGTRPVRVIAEAWVDVQRHACGLLCGEAPPRPGLTLRRYRHAVQYERSKTRFGRPSLLPQASLGPP